MKLTLLDTGGIVDETVELAHLADSLNYRRCYELLANELSGR